VSRSFLLDVNALVGLLWNVHTLHGRANAWFARESPRVLGCAFTELSFVRVSMADRTIAASFADAETALAGFIAALGRRYRFIDRLPPAAVLRGRGVAVHKQVSDLYLCELAASHGARLATLDQGIQHAAVSLIT
jgi:predicted nucleic acid-binding protein